MNINKKIDKKMQQLLEELDAINNSIKLSDVETMLDYSLKCYSDVEDVKPKVPATNELAPLPIKKYMNKSVNSSKKCKICGLEKLNEEFVINNQLGVDKPMIMKNKCKECYKAISKQYFKDHKVDVLKAVKVKKENNKKQYSSIIKFNNLEELTNQYEILKLKLENNLLEVRKYRKEYVRVKVTTTENI